MEDNVIIETKKLCKSFSNGGVLQHVLKNIDLEIYKGDFTVIMGASGAGKSTLLTMITGVVTPTSGNIEVNGKISSLLELGAAFNLELTGIDNIYQHRTSNGTYK
jgi:putative ABC transport system ATP-binding protein